MGGVVGECFVVVILGLWLGLVYTNTLVGFWACLVQFGTVWVFSPVFSGVAGLWRIILWCFLWIFWVFWGICFGFLGFEI